MVIDYDRRPNATVDEKLQSLTETVQLAFNEKEQQIRELQQAIIKLKEEINA